MTTSILCQKFLEILPTITEWNPNNSLISQLLLLWHDKTLQGFIKCPSQQMFVLKFGLIVWTEDEGNPRAMRLNPKIFSESKMVVLQGKVFSTSPLVENPHITSNSWGLIFLLFWSTLIPVIWIWKHSTPLCPYVNVWIKYTNVNCFPQVLLVCSEHSCSGPFS